jgi:outer membrane protein OmpA-like peptidoglycan-associated protein
MKKVFRVLLTLVFVLSISTLSYAQIDVEKKAEKEANEAIDDGFKKLKGVFKKKDKEKDKKEEEQQQEQQEQEQGQQQNESGGEVDLSTDSEPEKEETKKKPELTWSKYDFVPGEKVFFEDNLAGEENGEFPSRWDIKSGNVENAILGEDNVIMFRADSYIMPYIENADQDYLPEVFTLEFDCYFDLVDFIQNYEVVFHDKKNQAYNDIKNIRINYNRIDMGEFEGKYPGSDDNAYNKTWPGWRHISISFNKRALKVYMDDTRLINVPNITTNPTGITIWGEEHRDQYGYVKNIRLAEGGVKLYDKVMEDGKIIATGIRFDSGKTTLKPESMGIINEVAEMMTDHPELKFSVEGHTDSDGDDAFNMELSEKRAEVVVDELIARGVEADRLESKGFGESEPIDLNNTPEGKANNRRVEFVKL